MARQRDQGRVARRPALGVAGLTAVASGTTALLIIMGGSQLTQQNLATNPYSDGTSGGPMVVDETRTPSPATGNASGGGTSGTGDRGMAGFAGFGGRGVQGAPSAPTAPGTRVGGPVAAPESPVGTPPREVPVPTVPDVQDPGAEQPITPPRPSRPPVVVPGLPGVLGPHDDSDDSDDSDDDADSPDDSDSDDDSDSPDAVDSPDGVGSPGGVGSPNEGTPGCAVDAKGIQLPADAIERLEQWLCALTGRSVTVIGKPLELLSPVSGDAARSASKRTLAVGQAAVRLRVTQAASATHTRSATKAEKSDRAASKAKKPTGSRTSAKPESDRDRNDRDKSDRDKSDRHNDGSRKDKARDGRSHGSASRADSRRGHGNHRSDRDLQATVDDVSGSATGYSGRHRR